MSKKITIIKKQHNEHADYLVSSFDEGARAQNHSLQQLDFTVLKNEPKNLELDINKTTHVQFRVFFPQQAANSAANSEFRGMA